jgi:anti-sigma factor ChrR (cupin superfamily)
MTWAASPSSTVWRKRLELDGPAEAGRVTSVVRYDAGSAFHAHPHPDGEEILVLDGVFTDDSGDHPAGTYLLNPEGYEHAPSSRDGCVLFVKLRQYAGGDRPRVRIDTTAVAWHPHTVVSGVEVVDLYRSDDYPEQMRLVRFAPGTGAPTQSFPHGEEIFVVSGAYSDEHGSYRSGSWTRFEPGEAHSPKTGDGCVLYVKNGHLGWG